MLAYAPTGDDLSQRESPAAEVKFNAILGPLREETI